MNIMQNKSLREINVNHNIVLFPYGKVKAGSKIIIYGLGKIGQIFWQEVRATKYCHVEAMTGKDWKEYALLGEDVKVVNPECIKNIEFDSVVIASDKDTIRKEIFSYLEYDLAVPKEKIVSEVNFVELPYMKKEVFSDQQIDRGFSYNKQDRILSVAFLTGGGLGDVIIQKKIICAFLALLQGNYSIDMYGPIEFNKVILSDCANINNYFSCNIYEYQSRKYDLSINVMYTMSLDSIHYEKFDKSNTKLIETLRHLEKQLLEYNLVAKDKYELNSIHFFRCKYLNRNAYTAYNELGGIEINDSQVDIPLIDAYRKRYEALNLKKYITVHYGWGGAEFGKGHAKLWPIENYDKLIGLLHEKFKNLVVVQLGIDSDLKIKGIDRYVMGESLEVVKYVLHGSILHIDCDGGLVHMATQLGTKCAVLFGPTPVWYFGYEQNFNILSEVCNACSFLERDFTKCLRRLEKPECMLSITPGKVVDKIDSFLYQKFNHLDNIYDVID